MDANITSSIFHNLILLYLTSKPFFYQSRLKGTACYFDIFTLQIDRLFLRSPLTDDKATINFILITVTRWNIFLSNRKYRIDHFIFIYELTDISISLLLFIVILSTYRITNFNLNYNIIFLNIFNKFKYPIQNTIHFSVYL